MMKSGVFPAGSFHLLLLFLIPSSLAFSQGTDAPGRVLVGRCLVHECLFAVQSTDSAEIRMPFGAHMQFVHNQTVARGDLDALISAVPPTLSATGPRSIVCPFGDVYTLSSRDESELRLWFGTHAQLAHNKNLSDTAIGEMIRPGTAGGEK
jgi:hypothetical protein